MSVTRTVKATSQPNSVGVIFSEHDLQRALRLRKPPDIFELRLDGLLAVIDKLAVAIPRLRAPIIITARAPSEGGKNNLSVARRRELLLRFLADAAFVDVELSCAPAFSDLLKLAHARKLRVILSLHKLTRMPALAALRASADRAHSLGADIFKVAVRTDRVEHLLNLVEFLNSKSVPTPVSAMGVGKLGLVSRAVLANAGSVLNYAHLGHPMMEGQWSLAQLRAATARH